MPRGGTPPLGRFGLRNPDANRRRIIVGADAIADQTIPPEALMRTLFPPDVTGRLDDRRAPGYHLLSERTAHEAGKLTQAARADHNHDFSYLGLLETRVSDTDDSLYATPFENVSEGQNPLALDTQFHLRTVSWTVKEGFEDILPVCPTDVWARFDPAGGTAYGEWEKVAVVGPGETQAYYEAYPWNFDPNLGTVATVDVRVLPRNHETTALKVPRAGADGKLEEGWIPDERWPLAYADATRPANNTIANTAAQTSFGSTYTVPANRLRVGSVIRTVLRGRFSTDAAPPTIIFRFLYGGSTVLANSAFSTAFLANAGWTLTVDVVVATLGATGTAEVHGELKIQSAAADSAVLVLGDAAATTIDTTVTRSIAVSVQWGTASANNTISLHLMSVEILDVP